MKHPVSSLFNFKLWIYHNLFQLLLIFYCFFKNLTEMLPDKSSENYFFCVETLINDTLIRTKTVLRFYQCMTKTQTQRTYFLLSLLSSPSNPHQTKNQELRKGEKLMNYECSVAAFSLGMSTVVLLTSREGRRRRQDIFLHNLLISAL